MQAVRAQHQAPARRHTSRRRGTSPLPSRPQRGSKQVVRRPFGAGLALMVWFPVTFSAVADGAGRELPGADVDFSAYAAGREAAVLCGVRSALARRQRGLGTGMADLSACHREIGGEYLHHAISFWVRGWSGRCPLAGAGVPRNHPALKRAYIKYLFRRPAWAKLHCAFFSYVVQYTKRTTNNRRPDYGSL